MKLNRTEVAQDGDAEIIGTPNIPEVAHVLVDDHIVKEFSDVVATWFVDMRPVQLTNWASGQLIDIRVAPEPNEKLVVFQPTPIPEDRGF